MLVFGARSMVTCDELVYIRTHGGRPVPIADFLVLTFTFCVFKLVSLDQQTPCLSFFLHAFLLLCYPCASIPDSYSNL